MNENTVITPGTIKSLIFMGFGTPPRSTLEEV